MSYVYCKYMHIYTYLSNNKMKYKLWINIKLDFKMFITLKQYTIYVCIA